MRKFIKLCFLFYFFVKFRNLKVALLLARDGFPLERMNEISVRDGRIVVNKTGQAFTPEQIGLCRQSFNLFLDIASNSEAKIDNSSPHELYINWNNIRIRANRFDNFYIASELFIEGLYNMNCDSHRMVVMDVGMNVGVASLFFASRDNVEKVYSFEPFRPTYESALANFDLNPTVKQKIVPFNLGAGGHNSELEIPVSEEVDSAAMSTTDFVMQQVNTGVTKKVKVGIRDIKEIVCEVSQQHQGAQLFLKLDCEGAEYEIMEQLNTSGLLQRIRYIVIEWHMRGSAPLEKILEANGFCNVVFPRHTQLMPDMGMIYAFNMSEKNHWSGAAIFFHNEHVGNL